MAESPNSGRKLSEQDIYCKVSKLFENHTDLLEEFTRYTTTSPDEVQSSISAEHDDPERKVSCETFVPVPYPSVSSMPKQLEVETSKDPMKRVPSSSPAKVPKKKAKLQERVPKTSVVPLPFEDFDIADFYEYKKMVYMWNFFKFIAYIIHFSYLTYKKSLNYYYYY